MCFPSVGVIPGLVSDVRWVTREWSSYALGRIAQGGSNSTPPGLTASTVVFTDREPLAQQQQVWWKADYRRWAGRWGLEQIIKGGQAVGASPQADSWGHRAETCICDLSTELNKQ
jgi:hypothetical protein